jgi:hypothetical protein
MLLFTEDAIPDIRAGRLTVTWRLWKYAHVKPGKVYRTGFGGGLYVDDVRAVRAADISDADAAEAGYSDAHSLIAFARSHTGAEVSDDTLLYCVRFHYVEQVPEKPRLSLDEIRSKLEKLDRNSKIGPWTERTLRQIEESPGVVARRLAMEQGRMTPGFKTDVRKLKALGLTISLMIGYELSDLGQEYLDSLDGAD